MKSNRNDLNMSGSRRGGIGNGGNGKSFARVVEKIVLVKLPQMLVGFQHQQ
jgi:hypothetical protein